MSAAILAVLGLTTQCKSIRKVSAENHNEQYKSTLYASLQSEDSYTLNGPIMVGFTVTNPTDDTLKFTQYHTPFEGMMSKFLTVKDSAGEEVSYIGAMARRIVPPPANTYHSIAPGQTKSVTFDLKKGYKLEKTGAYTLQYQGDNISGVASGEPITILVGSDGQATIDNTLIIMVSKETSLEDMVKEATSYGSTILYKYDSLHGLAIKVPTDKSTDEAITYFEKLKGVLSVSKDQVSSIQQ